MSAKTSELTKIDPAKLKKLDEIAATALASNIAEGQGFTAAIAMADAMTDLMNLLDEPIVDKMMTLMNTSLGFKTDKDPSKPTKRNPNPVAYERAVVKQCCAEAILKGVQLVDNQFNIISGGAYITRNGYAFMLRKLPGFSAFEKVLGVPKVMPDTNGSQYFVSCRARWIYKGQPGSLSWGKDDPATNIVIPVDEWTKVDAILGKAERKFLKKVYEQVTGCQTTDGEVDDPEMLRAPKTAELPPGPRGGAPIDGKAEIVSGKPDEELRKKLKESNVSADTILATLKEMGIADDKLVDLFQLADEKIVKVLKAWASVVENSKLLKTEGK